MNTLFKIADEVTILKDMMEEDPENEVIKDTLEGLDGELEIKAEDYCKVIKEFAARAENLKKLIEELEAKKSSAEANADRLKKALFAAMKATGKEKIRGDIFYLYIKNNAESLDQVPDNLPDKYLIPQEPKVDKRTLLADVKAGTVIEGVTTKRTQCLVIK